MRLRYERQRNDEQYEEGAFCSRLYHTQTFFFLSCLFYRTLFAWRGLAVFIDTVCQACFQAQLCFVCLIFFYALFLILLCAATNSSIRRQASLVLQWCKRRVVPISAFLLIIVVMNFYHDFFFLLLFLLLLQSRFVWCRFELTILIVLNVQKYFQLDTDE